MHLVISAAATAAIPLSHVLQTHRTVEDVADVQRASFELFAGQEEEEEEVSCERLIKCQRNQSKLPRRRTKHAPQLQIVVDAGVDILFDFAATKNQTTKHRATSNTDRILD
jgi:hypothetical protein